jgi:hypothetical protein
VVDAGVTLTPQGWWLSCSHLDMRPVVCCIQIVMKKWQLTFIIIIVISDIHHHHRHQ